MPRTRANTLAGACSRSWRAEVRPQGASALCLWPGRLSEFQRPDEARFLRVQGGLPPDLRSTTQAPPLTARRGSGVAPGHASGGQGTCAPWNPRMERPGVWVSPEGGGGVYVPVMAWLKKRRSCIGHPAYFQHHGKRPPHP